MCANEDGIIDDWKFPMWDDVTDEFVQFKPLVIAFHMNTIGSMIMEFQAHIDI